MVFTGKKWADFVRRSTITQIESYPFDVLGSPTMKLILISSHFHDGILRAARDQLVSNDSRLHPSANITLRYISGNFPLHPRPPKSLFQILIHFVAARVNRISGKMSLIKDLFSKLKIFRHY